MPTNPMGITPPVVSTTEGPLWAEEINQILTDIIAVHNHQPAQDGGVQLTQEALNITDDLSLNGNQLINANAVGLETLNADASGSNRLYNKNGDLYYTDGNDTNVRITENGGLAAASFGGISGLSGTDGSATFAGLSTFVWKKDVTEYATMENGPIKVYSGNDAAPTSGINIIGVDSLGSDKTLQLSPENITLPQTLPNAVPSTSTGATATPSVTTSSLFISPTGEMLWNYVPPLNFVSSSAILTGSYVVGASTITNSTLNFTSSGRPIYVEVLGGNSATGYWTATNSSTMWMTLSTRVVHANGNTYDQAIKTYRIVDENTILGSFYPYSAIIDVPSGSMTISLRINSAGGGVGAAIGIGEGGAETYFSARQL